MATKKVAAEAAKVGKLYVPSAEDLFENGAHFGHTAKRWNPRMSKYIYSKEGGIHIFDLEKTIKLLNEANKFLTQMALEGKRICLVGTKRQAKAMIRAEADRAGLPAVTERWLGGTITNWKQIKSRGDKMVQMKAKRDAGEFKKYTKKEQLLFDREIAKLERFFGGLTNMKDYPEVLVVVDTVRERSAIREASAKGVKIVAIVDTNSDPDKVDYPIPMNDDSTKAVEMVVKSLVGAIELGVKGREIKN